MQTIPQEFKLTYLVAVLILIVFVIFIIFLTSVYKRRQSELIISKQLDEANLKNIVLEKEIEKQLALQSERDRISIDMHDDLGSGLSSIKLISEMLKKKHNDPASQEDLNSIVEHATELTSTMREMVWSLNPRNDSMERFLLFIQQYSRLFFEPSEMKLSILIPETIPDIVMSGYIRRNVFLCFKEILNNCVKHSKANHIEITCSMNQLELFISISDDGIGLPIEHVQNNGFYSMQKRMKDCSGYILWKNLTPGFNVSMTIPFNSTDSTNV